MEIFVRSDDNGAYPLLEEFALSINDEYEKQKQSLRLRVTGISRFMPPYLGMVARKVEGGVILDLPLTPPDMEKLRKGIERLTGKPLPMQSWKKKLIEQVSGCLHKNNVSFETVGITKEEYTPPGDDVNANKDIDKEKKV